jgi:hypothetical protein
LKLGVWITKSGSKLKLLKRQDPEKEEEMINAQPSNKLLHEAAKKNISDHRHLIKPRKFGSKVDPLRFFLLTT